MKWFLAAALILFPLACSKGGLEESCYSDGTCASPNLKCDLSGMGYRCFPRQEVKGLETSEADRFCEVCLKRCGTAGLKHCAYTDVTVWGSKPTVCECRGDVTTDKPHDGGK